MSIPQNRTMLRYKKGGKKMIYFRLKDLREDKDLNQTEIGRILGTSQKQYSRWETGETEIPFHCVIKLAKFYNISIDYIAGITNTPFELPKK